MKSKYGRMYVVWLSLIAGIACAAEPSVAVVNGVSIPTSLMERNVQVNVAKGQSDTLFLRSAIKDELIARELMVQEAIRRGLDKRKDSEGDLQVLRQNYLIDVLVQDELIRTPVTEADLKVEYERQAKALKAGEMQQYQLAAIVLESETEARNVMMALRTGQSFESQARAKSLDSSKARGGDLGWLLAEQMTPMISNVVVNLSVGAISAAPIPVGSYWHVVKLQAKRPFKLPTFDESKESVLATVIQGRRMVLLKELQTSAKITP